MLTIAGGLLSFTIFSPAMKTPAVALLAQDAAIIAAPGAAALAHSVSRIASSSSEFRPGERQLFGPLAGGGLTEVSDPLVYCARPNVVRNVVQSEAL